VFSRSASASACSPTSSTQLSSFRSLPVVHRVEACSLRHSHTRASRCVLRRIQASASTSAPKRNTVSGASASENQLRKRWRLRQRREQSVGAIEFHRLRAAHKQTWVLRGTAASGLLATAPGVLGRRSRAHATLQERGQRGPRSTESPWGRQAVRRGGTPVPTSAAAQETRRRVLGESLKTKPQRCLSPIRARHTLAGPVSAKQTPHL
jgi:hypothetical protein